MTISQKHIEAATLDNARIWNGLTDQYVFCLDLLDLSLEFNHHSKCDRLVNQLEEAFEVLLQEAGETVNVQNF